MRLAKIAIPLLALIFHISHCEAFELIGKGWDSQVIHLIVPFSAGTGVDTLARIMAPELSKSLNKPVVVENKPGASGNIGTAFVKNSRSGNSNLLVTASTITTNFTTNPQLNVNPITELSSIALIAVNDLVLVVPESSPFLSAAMLISKSKEKPELVTFGSPGIGTPHYKAMGLFEKSTHTTLLHIPFKDSATAISSLLGGEIDSMFLPINIAKPLIESNKIRALGVAANVRSSIMKNIPTLKEQGIGNVNCPIWYGVFASNMISKQEESKLTQLLHVLMNDPAIKSQIEKQGLIPKLIIGSRFRQLIESDVNSLGN